MSLIYNYAKTKPIRTAKKLFENIEGAYDWNSAIYSKLNGISGTYIIAVKKRGWCISYPLKSSNIIYIGQTQDIGKRLNQHKLYPQNNQLKIYVDIYSLNVYFREILDYSQLKVHESEMINQFMNKTGGIPICNNRIP